MDRRTLLALVLMALVIVLTPMIFPSKRPAPRIDTTAASVATNGANATPQTASVKDTTHVATASQLPENTIAPARGAPNATGAPNAPGATPVRRPADSTVVATAAARYTIVSPGAAPSRVLIPGYRNLRPGRRDSVVIATPTGPLLRYRVAMGRDTIDLDTVSFTAQPSGNGVTFVATSPAISITYAPEAKDPYRVAVRGTFANAPAGSALLIDLPNSLNSSEADTLDDFRHLAYGYKEPLRDVTSVPFSKLDSGAVRVDTASMQWVAARNKYWLVALMKPVGTPPGAAFHGLISRGGPRIAKIARSASATTVHPLTNGQVAFDLYVGPQSFQELHALGNDLENVNPYAGWLHAIVQPFATIVMRILLWMKATLRLNYGWVLVLFGVLIRLILWPLNQKAMRTSIQMQRLQPELQEVQKRYKDDPAKQRDALVKLYQEHGMSPISPMLGCLPMLLPMPVLFALYFVFQNTIEFRGVSFLWLPDISLRDPYYITPIVMGLSMFVLSWIGMKGSPPNPQTKMMSYMMPVMFTVMFLNFAAGLNLYYLVQNIAALPQQWVLTKERAKAGVGTPPAKRRA